ncbi:hypothetical protein HMPREF1861_00371 [Corynebacterium kroppenstedtii]|nr:hypothetical protein HMPREF1861_00371 [Corynebacterium kroppenstedtii]
MQFTSTTDSSTDKPTMPTMNTIEHTNSNDGRFEGLRYVIQPVPNIHVNSVRHRGDVLRYDPDINNRDDGVAQGPPQPTVLRAPRVRRQLR